MVALVGLLIFGLLPHGTLAYNSTTDYHNVACVYPISGVYGLLNRILFYVLWVVAFAGSKWTWPAIGSMAWIMTYAATASMHAFILAVSSSRSGTQVDLDAVGTWAIVSVAALCALPIIWYSSRLRDSMYRPIFAFWSTVVLIGALCSVIAMFTNYPTEPPCAIHDSKCLYSCLNTRQILRDPKDMEVVLARRLYDGVLRSLQLASAWMAMMVGSCLGLGFFSFCLAGDRRRTKPELESAIRRPIPKYATAKSRTNMRKAKERARKELSSGKYVQVRNYYLYLNPIVLPIVVAFNEAYILARSGLPTNEAPFNVGQWGSWVTVGFALLAAGLNSYYEPRWNKLKAALDADREEILAERKRPPCIRMALMGEKKDDITEWAQEASRVVVDASGYEPPPKPPPCAFRPLLPIQRIPPVVDVQSSDGQAYSGYDKVRRYKQDQLSHGDFTGKGPFNVGDIAKMPILGYDQPCAAYDEWGPQYDRHVIYDSNGRHWVVYKGVLFKRELWRA